jgi:hypothetical protein
VHGRAHASARCLAAIAHFSSNRERPWSIWLSTRCWRMPPVLLILRERVWRPTIIRTT